MLENFVNQNQYGTSTKAMSSDFFRSVYSYMFIALAISGGIAYLCGTPEFVINYFISEKGGVSALFYIVAFAPVGLGWLIQSSYNRFSMGTLFFLYGLYAALLGLSLSTIFVVYDIASIASTFFVSAGAFAGMAILGYTTKTDLTKFGSLLYMAFIGIFIASIVNFFMNSDTMSLIIAIIGVFVFTGLTAYQMQQLKHISEQPGLQGADRNKLALVAVILYTLSMAVLSFHLMHGFSSAFQSLGIRHKRYTPSIELIGKIFAIVVPALFAIIPIYLFVK
jgi:FtsH-binding integral membrane protein